jgi:NAD(P)-dependent dehydrogenase (short-subunit alcohol dehydrogenase family)
VKRVCLLTGASGSLGTTFIDRYATVYEIIAVHNRSHIQYATQDQIFFDPLDLHRPIPENSSAVYAYRVDLARKAEIDQLVQDVQERFGGVDLLINAAAVRAWANLLAPGAIESASAFFVVNVLAPLRLATALACACWMSDPPANLERNRNIVNVSSTAGLFVYPDTGQALYATSKAALNHLTYHLASEFWDIGIRVNAVAPDTFPERVPTSDVLDAIIELDRSDQTGQVVPLYREAPVATQ